jgi:hypothetical protein
MTKAALAIGVAALIGSHSAQATTCMAYVKYEVREGKVYFHSPTGSNEVPGIDAGTFRAFADWGMGILGCPVESYAVDRATLLFYGERVKDADAATFQLVDGTVYAKDRSRVYYGGREISRAADSFRGIGRYGTDGNQGFYDGQLLPGDRFAILERGPYAKSGAAAFWFGRTIEGADAPSFELVTPSISLAKDSSRVYYEGREVRGADPQTLRHVHGRYFRDARAVYVSGREIDGADPDSFRLLAPHLPVHAQRYAKDRRGIYYDHRQVTGADPETFALVQVSDFARDKAYGYELGRRTCAWDVDAASGLPACDPKRFQPR